MPTFHSVRIRTRLALLFSALVFVSIGFGVFSGARRSISDAARVAHTQQVLRSIDDVQSTLLQTEIAARSYELTGNQAYLSNYRDSAERVPRQLAQLRALIFDNPAQIANLDILQRLVQARLTQLQQMLDLYQRDGLAALQRAMAPSVFKDSSAIGDHVQQMTELEQQLLLRRDRSNQRSSDLLLALALAGIPFGLGSVGVVYALLFRELRNRSHAEQAASVANDKLAASIHDLERTSADLNALSRYTGLLQSCVDPKEALAVTARMLAALMPDAGGSVYLLHASMDRAESIVAWGEPPVRSVAAVAPEECWALRRDKTHFVHALRHDAACAHLRDDPQAVGASSACIPLSAQGTQLGFVFLAGPGRGPLPRIAIAEAAAEQLSLALSNLRLRESLRLQSIRDPLTGLFNRRYLEESLNHELTRCARRSVPLSLLMLDVDHFKHFNDLHGHGGGDSLLAAVGQMLASRLRGEDIACRYGGEEFTVILPETDAEAALAIAEQIRGAAQQMRTTLDGKALPGVTLSIGLASYSRDGVVATTLLRKADAALYRAKRNGRNQVQPFDPALDGMG
ncbi:histidine kinase [Xanthomonas translucens pv. arrhenatheri]|jgi:diguanylate cyclase (GGDEF)-like protein|uniref:diguanylate cyclase n=2 Tax=Xanthomonas graminis TaxID=3390026 RepID=A0A0K2ZMA3_9XANT|nr:diguanylate cyclase [Xanthomonas translucens]EKU25947.1 Putative sensor protein [Xanthomonas translucens pv. graminis ART-Xtg29]OAX61180.1 histidine kinase [Xanthomonas translucens pv. graminis]OAX65309.1 histidine kinase [Xanthomonas translucens pv. arrhenatheri]UKE53433.1 diguanylate cyclase [Xanthomonas translucens pv. graminis]UKE76434.1 diguanylate cyclase [Xanthomonas translucens pv. arrhenatheri]